jgi:hypothetical protein
MLAETIIPGKGVGKYQLGMSCDDLTSLLPLFTKEQRESYFVVYSGNFSFWIDEKTLTVTQIGVSGNYQGKILDKVGIGDTLVEVEEHFGKSEYVLYVWEIVGLDGIALELEDNDIDEDWDEMLAPIESIYVAPFRTAL